MSIMTYQKARYQQNHEFVKNIKKELPEISVKEDNVIRGVFPSVSKPRTLFAEYANVKSTTIAVSDF